MDNQPAPETRPTPVATQPAPQQTAQPTRTGLDWAAMFGVFMIALLLGYSAGILIKSNTATTEVDTEVSSEDGTDTPAETDEVDETDETSELASKEIVATAQGGEITATVTMTVPEDVTVSHDKTNVVTVMGADFSLQLSIPSEIEGSRHYSFVKALPENKSLGEIVRYSFDGFTSYTNDVHDTACEQTVPVDAAEPPCGTGVLYPKGRTGNPGFLHVSCEGDTAQCDEIVATADFNIVRSE